VTGEVVEGMDAVALAVASLAADLAPVAASADIKLVASRDLSRPTIWLKINSETTLPGGL
jgi:hypothetical protein